MDRIAEIRTFVAVADVRSFAQGARRVGISPAQASKLIARLEDRLGARLLNRTTRDVSLTDTGRAYLERARELLDQFEALESSVREASGPRGLLRITAPVTFGAVQLDTLLLDFAAAYPEVGLEVSYSDRTVNLVDEGFDAAIRIMHPADSSLVARKVSETRVVTCASPDYLARRGAPTEPAQLAEHDVVIDTNMREAFDWRFGRGAAQTSVRVHGRLRFSCPTACLDAACAGFGVARAPAFAAIAPLRSGKLVTLLCEHEPEPIPIHVVYPHARHLAPKVRVFVDFVAKRFAGEPDWHKGWLKEDTAAEQAGRAA